MISLIIPPKDQISRVSKMLADEFGTASNIKSRVNRLSVLGAITSVQQRLKLYNKGKDYEPCHDIMVLFILRKLVLQTHSSNGHAQPSSGARCLIFGQTFYLLPYFVCANSEGSGETAWISRLAQAFAGRLCDKYPLLMSWVLQTLMKSSICRFNVFFLYPLQNRVLRGYTVFSMSVIPSFRQHLRVLLYNFDSFCPILFKFTPHLDHQGERGGSVVECRTREREVGGSKPTAAVLCPWARHFTPRTVGKNWWL